jgi:hypothetical protein
LPAAERSASAHGFETPQVGLGRANSPSLVRIDGTRLAARLGGR